ncbi:MAG: site-specific integrase [Acidobacteria bacterium]|nr:site-specific integrase [Acidobacteriota bacterium]
MADNARRTGQIIKRGDDAWLVRIYLGEDSSGRRRYANKTVRGTKREAQKWLNSALRDCDLGLFVEPAAITLNDYFDKWLEVAARPRVSQRTADGYAGLLERYIRPTIGHKRLESLQPLDIQKVYGEMQMRGLSARVVRHTHSALHNALKQAVKWGMIIRNPSDLAELPKVPHKERRVLSPDEAARFLEAADIMPHGLIFEVALLSGMRPEEYLALQWSDVDVARGTAQVRRALVRHNKSWSFEEPKTARSRRTVFLPAPLLTKLAAHKRKQSEVRLKLGAAWHAHDIVFCSEQGTPHTIPNLTYRYFRPILEKAELPRIRLYDLRHTCATLLLIAEENPKVVSERLGHSTIVLTLDTYSHVLPTMQQNATARLEKMLYPEFRTHFAHKMETGS